MTGTLTDRLREAVASEVEFSASLIDGGLPVTPRARLLGRLTDHRVQFAGLMPQMTDAVEFTRLVGSTIWGALLYATGERFVLTDVDYNARTFTTYGVGRNEHGGMIAALARPFDHLTAMPMRLPDEGADIMKNWIPPTPAQWPDDPVERVNIDALFRPGGHFETVPIGTPHLAFNTMEGRA